MIEDCTAIILAGGNSSRMGQDKAMLPFNGTPLLQSVIAVVQPLFGKTMVSVNAPRAEIALPQICDRQTGMGPLAGLVSALEQVTTPWTFVVACDMPFVAPAVIVQLAALRGDHQAVVPRIAGYPQPLLAFYATGCLPLLQARLAGGDRSLMGALKLLNVRYAEEGELTASSPRSFIDLDTPQDVARAEGMMQ
ncbi:MAG: molybdenum cofactor guanylyltransferase [Gallionella sp.]|nr:molybdenum cofactor guanylyltransferase [Gallionella sp.]MDD4946553.1 molybdenum cofactor guanylyltransferase [Gallionella sp.]